MAELVGLISGGAGLLSLGGQLLEGAIRLRSFWASAKRMPLRLSRVTTDLENIGLLLQQIGLKNAERDKQESDILQRCVNACQQAVKDIQNDTDKLAYRMGKLGSFGNFYCALKASDLEELYSNLEHAKTALMMAYQVYQSSQQEYILSKLERRLQLQEESSNLRLDSIKRDIKYIQQPGCEPVTTIAALDRPGDLQTIQHDYYADRIRDRCGRDSARLRYSRIASIRLPLWLQNRAFQFALSRSQAGWDFCLTISQQTNYRTPIFDACYDGDLNMIRLLLDRGMATLRDTCTENYPWETNLLQAAVRSKSVHSIEVCQWLLRTGVFTDDEMISALRGYANRLSLSGLPDYSSHAFQMYHAFIETGGLFISRPPNRYEPILNCGNGLPCIRIVLKDLVLSYEHALFSQRLQLALDVWKAVQVNPSLDAEDTLKIFLWVCGCQTFDSVLARTTSSNKSALVHALARCIGRAALEYKTLDGYVTALESLILSGADMNSPVDGITPLVAFLSAPTDLSEIDDTLTKLERKLRIWLRILKTCRVDLDAYGAAEREIWNRADVYVGSHRGGIQKSTVVIDDSLGLRCQIWDFRFGPDPSSWYLLYRSLRRVDVLTLQAVPGSFPSNTTIPRCITWFPSGSEAKEGIWKVTNTFRISSGIFDSSYKRRKPVYEDLLNMSQDDSGAVCTLLDRGRGTRRCRSVSQPPALNDHREPETFLRCHKPRQTWLPSYHLCPFDRRYRFGCATVRNCIHDRRCSLTTLLPLRLWCEQYVEARRFEPNQEPSSLKVFEEWDPFFNNKWHEYFVVRNENRIRRWIIEKYEHRIHKVAWETYGICQGL